jgi:hypothetical protein
MSIPQNPNSDTAPDERAPAPEGSAVSFIVNLCALPGPAVPEPPPTELEGLRAFVSRRTKDGIHRFYLHVGYFHTLDDAEAWLANARTMYPNAFVSKLADTLRPSEPGAPPRADTEVLKVLEVRGPRRDGESGDTGSYAVQSEARVLGTPPAAPAVAWPMPPPVSQAPPAKPPVRADVPKPPPTAAEAWSTFVAEANSDSLSTSGVRHLRVEIQRPRNRSSKPSKTRK